MKRAVVAVSVCMVFIINNAGFGRERTRRVPLCCPAPQSACIGQVLSPVRGAFSRCYVNPCLCPQDLAYDPDESDGIYYYIVARYNCDCVTGACNNPVQTIMPTDSFIEFPQLCEEYPGCEFAPYGYALARHVGMKAAKDPEFEPKFKHRLPATVHRIDRAYLTFPTSETGPVITAVAYIFKLDDVTYAANLHPHYDHNKVGTSKSHNVVLGFQTNGVGTHPIDYAVNWRHVEKSTHAYVYHVSAGGVTYPIVITQPPL